EDGVAVGEAPEAVDDGLVRLGPAQVLLAQGREQRHGTGLRGGVFGVLERQIEELPPLFRQSRIEAASYCRVGYRERLGVHGEGGGRAAEHVAGELVEHDGGRERGTGIGQAGLVPKRGDGRVQRQEPLAQLLIESVVALEPLLRRGFLEPEVEHLGSPTGWVRLRHRNGLVASYRLIAVAAISAAKRSTVSGVVSQAHMRRQPVSPRNV